MNELAERLKIDPVKLRILNEPKIDESLGIPFSSRHLVECFELGAEKFGWSKRTPEVGSMKRDGLTLGWGMAGCAWLAARFAAEASLQLREDGTVRVACATQDIGTGTYTNLRAACVAEDRRSARANRSRARRYVASIRPGFWRFVTTESVIPAVFAREISAIASLLTIASMTPGSPFENRKPDELAFEGGRVFVKAEVPARACRLPICCSAPIGRRDGQRQGEGTFGDPKPKFSTHSYRLPLRRSHLAAGDRAAAREPGCVGDGCGADSQSAGRPEPNRGRSRHGHRHGAVRAHVL